MYPMEAFLSDAGGSPADGMSNVDVLRLLESIADRIEFGELQQALALIDDTVRQLD